MITIRRGVLVAPVLFSALLVACDRKPSTENESGEEESPYPTLGATLFPPDQPLPKVPRLEISKRVHEVIADPAQPSDDSEMEPYDLVAEQVGKVKLKMLVVPDGEFLFGSDREGEGPLRNVRVDAFWMSETELPWRFYSPFLGRGERPVPGSREEREAAAVDLVSGPSEPYRIPSATNAEHPATNMTHHAASKYCQWISAQTGHFYRLPTEAEWEYACRAGTTTAYSFGDNPAQLGDYAWYADNSEFACQRVKRKKPNAWGLYDMHGNAAEWVLDGFDPGFRQSLVEGVRNPWCIPQSRYPRLAKGGSWDDEAGRLRSSARLLSHKRWKNLDPAVPKSIWYHTNAEHVGFRLVRPLKTPSAEEMHLFWNTDWSGPERNAEDLK